MKQKVLFDTNIILLWSSKKLDRDAFILRFKGCRWAVSEITEMELLSYPQLSAAEEAVIRAFLKQCNIIRFNRNIKAKTVQIRKAVKLKLPDAIIAAAAVLSKSTLINNDSRLSKASYPGLFVETV
jgi:predicted nucleic acid-binding protein